MTAKYNVIPKFNPNDPAAPPLHYPSVKSTGRTSLRQLVGYIADTSTVSPADTVAVLESLLSLVPQQMGQGNIVELGDFGSFWIRVQTEGSESSDKVTARNIKAVKPQFRPGKTFKQALSLIEFQKLSVD